MKRTHTKQSKQMCRKGKEKGSIYYYQYGLSCSIMLYAVQYLSKDTNPSENKAHRSWMMRSLGKIT